MRDEAYTDHMHLQWFAEEDGEQIEGFEPADEDEAELVIRSPEEVEAEGKAAAASAAPQVVTMSAEDYSRLKAAAERDPVAALNSGLEAMASRMQPQVVNAPAQAAGESDEEFNARIEKMAFTTGSSAQAIREAARREIMGVMGPVMQQIVGMSSEQMEMVLESHPEKGPLYKKYKPEVEKELAGMTPVERSLPTARTKALAKVLERHAPDLEEERFNARLEARLKELGVEVKDGKAVAQKPAAQNATLGGGAAGGGGRRQVTVTVSTEDRAKWTAQAESAGVEPDDYIKSKLRQRGVKV